ncbi:MAG: hypothetical protein VYA51_13255 [Planctomycetota bacterium]|nr:hypothetical protein [Planctomycetota bacterium]
MRARTSAVLRVAAGLVLRTRPTSALRLLRDGVRAVSARVGELLLRERPVDARALALGVAGVRVMERPADVSCAGLLVRGAR